MRFCLTTYRCPFSLLLKIHGDSLFSIKFSSIESNIYQLDVGQDALDENPFFVKTLCS